MRHSSVPLTEGHQQHCVHQGAAEMFNNTQRVKRSPVVKEGLMDEGTEQLTFTGVDAIHTAGTC